MPGMCLPSIPFPAGGLLSPVGSTCHRLYIGDLFMCQRNTSRLSAKAFGASHCASISLGAQFKSIWVVTSWGYWVGSISWCWRQKMHCSLLLSRTSLRYCHGTVSIALLQTKNKGLATFFSVFNTLFCASLEGAARYLYIRVDILNVGKLHK